MADKAQPDYCRPELEAVKPDLTLVSDLLAGTRRMWEQSKVYIRKWADEAVEVYNIRRQCETVFGGLDRTLSAANGMLFAKAPLVEWNESEDALSPHWDNLDAAGTKGTVLVKRFSEAAIRDGIGVILVDHPSAPIDPETKQPITITAANEKELGLRPTWALYDRAQAINWRTAVINGQRVLTMLVLHECVQVEDGDYGVRPVNRYRVLRLVKSEAAYVATWTLLEEQGGEGASQPTFAKIGAGIFTNKNGEQADFLPISIAYTGRTRAPMTATIPLMPVAWANLAHWRKSTDIEFYEECCAFPQPTVTGTLAQDPQVGTPPKLRIGPMVAVHLSEADAKYQWTELAGTSLDQLKQSREEKLGQMAKSGMAFLVTDTRAAETAEAKRLDASAENSTLSTSAQGVEDAVNGAWEHHCWYEGIPKESAPVLTINRDFESTVMDAPTMLAYCTAVEKVGFPKRLLLEAWQQGGRIGPDVDLDQLELEMEAAAAAQQEQERQAAEDAHKMQLEQVAAKQPKAA